MTSPWSAWSCFPLSLLLFLIYHTTKVHASDYLYSVLSPEESFPVIEYEPPSIDTAIQNKDQGDNVQPDFLYSPQQGHRLVLFYLPWCPHCQAYVPTYIGLARRVREITTAHNLPTVEFFALSCLPNKQLCKDQHVSGVPGIKIIPAGSTDFTGANPITLHPFQILRTLGISLGAELEDEEGAPRNFLKGNNPVVSRRAIRNNQKNKKRNKVDIYADAYRSFHFAMKTGIFTENGPLPEKPRAALGAWLQLLQNTVPLGWRLQPLLQALLAEFDAVANDENKLLEVLDKYPPMPATSGSSDWSPSCSHGEEGQGYTCGLWGLFHIITVGMVEYNENAISTDQAASLHTAEVAQTLRDYIEHFFECKVCRTHFLKAYDDCAFDRCHRLVKVVGERRYWIQLPLWLAEEHNAVNLRLMRERAKNSNSNPQLISQDEESAEWPARSDCPKCWKGDGTFDREVTYLYLLQEYW